MGDEQALLDMLGVDIHVLSQVIQANPSLRGVIVGYITERMLWDVFASDARITAIRKDDDHDRDNKGDIVITYNGLDFRIEVKSLQTNSIRMFNPETKMWMPKILKQPRSPVSGPKRMKNKWVECQQYRVEWQKIGRVAKYHGKVQCDASDCRSIELPNGHRVKTTNLKTGEFDILAMGLFGFRETWDFGFMLNRDLPRTSSSKYTPDDRQYLLKTLIPIEWPLPPSCSADPFILLDKLVEDRQRTTPSREI